MNELKTIILETTVGVYAVHVPGDRQVSLRRVKTFLEAREVYLASPEYLRSIPLSPGTVCPVLEPVWSLRHSASSSVLDLEFRLYQQRHVLDVFSLFTETPARRAKREGGRLHKIGPVALGKRGQAQLSYSSSFSGRGRRGLVGSCSTPGGGSVRGKNGGSVRVKKCSSISGR